MGSGSGGHLTSLTGTQVPSHSGPRVSNNIHLLSYLRLYIWSQNIQLPGAP